MTPRAPEPSGNGRIVAAGLCAALPLLCLTLWMWRSAAAESALLARERFEFRLAEAEFAIQERLLAYQQVLRGAVGLYAASDDVSRAEWEAYVRALEIERNFPGIQGIGFAARVAPAGLEAHQRRLRAEGFADYAVRPPDARADYVPMTYMAPLDWRNQRVLGHDMLAEPSLRVGLERARDSGLAAVSGKLTLEQETADGVQSGFVMCLPVYANGQAHASVAQRRAALGGYVCSTFRAGDLMQGILGPEKLADIRLQIFDGVGTAPEQLLYDTLEGMGAAPAVSFRRDQVFAFEGREWLLRFDALPAFAAGVDAQKPRFILFGGLLISLLFGAVAWSLALNRRRARALAALNAGLEAEIAERIELARELQRARDAAEAANHAKSDFLANVSHELRTPLTLILAPQEQMLAGARFPAEWRPALERAQRNALLLLNRVNDILDFSKAEAGKFELRPEPLELAQLLGALAGDAAEVARGKGCALDWQVAPTLGTVCLDPGHFEKIVLNLLANAIKFTPAGGRIEVTAAPAGAGWFELAVQDSGIGIAPERQALLFQRFSQIDTSATRQYSGTGIGLALVRELAELMGGSAGVDSALGRGARFFVRLPDGAAAAPADAQAAGPRAPRSAAESAQRRLRFEGGGPAPRPDAAPDAPDAPDRTARRKVLVVDDSADMLDYVAELLGGEYEVATAVDGEQAWELLQRHPVDVIVSDVMMPRLDGLGLTARLKASAALSHLPVILLTARGGGVARVSGLDGGADDYLAKPFSPAELLARVRAALRMGQAQAQLRAASRQAGMAEIASNVLHNVGNVLNSVNVSAATLGSALRASKTPGLGRAVELMQAHADDLGGFLTQDERGKQLPGYLKQLALALAQEQAGLFDELARLTRSVDHIKDIVATQQSYASAARVVELVQVRDLLDDALRMHAGALARHEVTVVKQFAAVPALPLDKHQLLQILVNLIGNAKQAMAGAGHGQRLTLGLDMVDAGDVCDVGDGGAGPRLRIRVADEGDGIAPEHLLKIFNHGFTTRENGHGFGLHSCALAARAMGGTLSAHSAGPGRGATFTLELPVTPPAPTPETPTPSTTTERTR